MSKSLRLVAVLTIAVTLDSSLFAQTLSPATLAFGNQTEGTTATKTETLTNRSAPLFIIDTIAVSGASDFQQSGGTCQVGTQLQLRGQCTVLVGFTPTTVGAESGNLTINGNGTPLTAALTGTGITPVTLSVSSLNLGTVAVGNTSARSVTLTNRENKNLSFSSITASGDFSIPIASNTCGASIAAGATCTVGVTFSPTAVGTRTGTLTITDDANNSPQTVSLTGTGSGASVTISPKTLTFASRGVSTLSPDQTVTLTNHLNTSLAVSTVVASGDFVVHNNNNCGASVGAGLTCTILVAFIPTALGPRSGTLTITYSAFGSPSVVNLAGIGNASDLVSITVTPVNPKIAPGTAEQFTATGTWSDTSTQNLTTSVTWTSSAAGVATISNASGTQGLASSSGLGTSTITAKLNSKTGSTFLSVAAPALVSIAVTPTNPSIPVGGTQQFSATGTYSDGGTKDVSSLVTWTSSVTSVASISTAGLATATGLGTSSISASAGAITGSTMLVVGTPVLVEQVNAGNVDGILVQQSFDPLQVSGIAQPVVIASPTIVTSVTAHFANSFPKNGYVYLDLVKDDGMGKPSNQLADILGTSTNNGYGLYGGGGYVSFTMPSVAVPAGTFYVVVRTQNILANGYGALLFTTGRTSTPPGMGPVQVQNPSTQNWSVAASQQFLTFSLAALSTTIPSLSSIAVVGTTGFIGSGFGNPPIIVDRPAIVTGATHQFDAIGVHADGTMEDLADSAAWSSSNSAVAAVNSSGLATGLAVGTSTISASSGPVNGSTTLTVGSALTVQQTASDTSILVDPQLVSGIGQRLILPAPILVTSVTVQGSESSQAAGYAYVDIVKDDGIGNPSNSPADIIAASINQMWDLAGNGSFVFQFLPTTVPAGPFHMVLRTGNVSQVGNGALTVTTGSSSSLTGLAPVQVQNPSTQAWSAASPAGYLTFSLSAVRGSGPFAYVANSSSNNVSVIDTASNTVVATVPVGSGPFGVAITPNGAFAYVTNSVDKTVSVINTATNTVMATVPVGSQPLGVAITPNGAFAYVTNSLDNTISVIDTVTNMVVATKPAGVDPNAVVITPSGAFAYVVNDQTVSVIDTATNTVVATGSVPAGPGSTDGPGVAITPNGAFVYVSGGEGNASVVNTATNTVVATVSTTGNIRGSSLGFIAVTPNGAFGYGAVGGFNEVAVFDTTTNAVVATVPVGSDPFGAAITPNGAFAYVTNHNDNTVSVINTAANAVVATVPVGSGPFGVAITP